LGSALRGRSRLSLPWATFARALLQATRPHYFPLPAGACLAGAAATAGSTLTTSVLVAAAAAGLGWGVGQLLNDLMDAESDALNAPARPAVRGLLPEGPTMAAALGLGLLVAAATVAIHPRGWLLALVAAVLLAGYGLAKPWPVAGNLAHGALIAVAAAIGAAAAAPEQSLAAVVSRTWPTCALAGAWSAIYLEANYEKDRRGDARAGCRTLAHVVGLRLSASLRMVGAVGVGIGVTTSTPPTGPIVTGALTVAVGLVVLSAALVMRGADEQSAHRSYRIAVHGAAIGMLAMAGPMLGGLLTPVAMAASVGLTERAFRADGRAP